MTYNTDIHLNKGNLYLQQPITSQPITNQPITNHQSTNHQSTNHQPMLLYNVTITVDQDIHEEWMRWMREMHIPDVMSTGMFISYRFSRLMGHEHVDSEIFTVQYLVKDAAHLRRYQEEFAPALQQQHRERYEGKFAAFRTVMEVIDHNDKI